MFLPGLAQRASAPKEFWGGWTRLYQMAWFVGCATAGAVYMALDYFWPIPDKLAVDDEDVFGTFEENAIIEGKEESCNEIVVETKDIEAGK